MKGSGGVSGTILAALLVTGPAPAAEHAQIVDEEVDIIEDGIQLNTVRLSVDGQEISARVLDADTAVFGLHVATSQNPDRRPEPEGGRYKAAGYSIREFAAGPDVVAAMTGTYLSSFTPPLALGYVRAQGETYNSAHGSWLTTGMVCTVDGVPQIFESSSGPLDDAEDCIQSGPLLVQGGSAAWAASSPSQQRLWNSAQEQAIICTYGQGVRLIVTEPITTGALMPLLTVGDGPLACTDAVRLSGAQTAELHVTGRGGFTEFETLMPNAFVVVRRSGAVDDKPAPGEQ